MVSEYTSEQVMRTNIELDDELLAMAQKITGLPTKRAVVEEGLRRIVRAERQRLAIERLRGIGWEGSLDEMRNDHP